MDIAHDILEDNGFKSRKYVALYVYWGLVTVYACAGIHWTAAAALFPQYWMALSAGLGAYFGVNWGHSFLAKKTVEGQKVTDEVQTILDDDIPKPSK